MRANEEGRVNALGLFHRTISEVEDAILQAKARQAYRSAGEPAEERADSEEQAVDLAKRFPVMGAQ
ncbi:hypothetical protein OG598_24975 [Micromonospora sp. NBC_00330]|uniref:hypothetical protein n=1 Tax=Micromonospora sp. NBC_00330 TaxID=2903585 RepID=UPI002E2B0ACA|nr:hypothetical protein [Micromonospora sp. NBC_00330]